MITQDALQPSSPVASDTSNESEKDFPRVFFGPFKTPEKRFAAIAAIPDQDHCGSETAPTPTPAHTVEQPGNSSSPSPSTCSEDILDVERLVAIAEEPVGSGRDHVNVLQRGSSPDYDEPPSALTSKLLLALDNPSPPPSPALRMSTGVDEIARREEGVNSFEEYEDVPPLPGTSPSRPTVQHTGFPTLPSPSSEPDLMMFDSIDGVPDLVAPLHTDTVVPPQILPPSPFTFPDDSILDTHPTHCTPEVLQEGTDILIDLQDVGSTPNIPTTIESEQQHPDTGDDQTLCNAPSGSEQVTSITSTLSPPQTTSHSADVLRSHQSSGPPAAEDLQQTPLRRSSRPRKSATPHTLKYLASPSPNKDQSLPFLSTVQTPKSKKGKDRAAAPSDYDNDTESKEHDLNSGSFKPDRKDHNVEFQRRFSRSPVRPETMRELGSLSPNSEDLLTRLIPSNESPLESTPIRNSSPDKQEAMSTLGPSLSSRISNVHIPLSGSHQPPALEGTSTVIGDPKRSSSPLRTPYTPRRPHTLHSPPKPRLQPISLDDPSRTPARRVPIKQAIAEGRISPQKLLQMQTSTHAVSPFTGQAIPILNTSLRGDASPARRVFFAPSTSHEVASHTSSPSKDDPVGPESQQASRSAKNSLQNTMTKPQPAKLPYPLVVAPKTTVNLGESGSKADEPSTPGPGSPTKSSLKKTTSRIPRKKPYSKPNVVSTSTTKMAKVSSSGTADKPQTTSGGSLAKKSITATNATSTTAVKRVIRAVDLSKTTTNKFNHLTSPSPPPAVMPIAKDPSARNDVLPATGHLKRKRLDSKSGPVASSRSTALRQVPTVATSTAATTFSWSSASSFPRVNQSTSGSRTQQQATTKKPPVVKFRRVITSEPWPHTPTLSEEPGQLVALSRSEPTPKQLEIEDARLPLDKDVTLASPITKPPPSQESPPATTPLPTSPPSLTSPPPSSPPPLPPLVFVIDPLSPVLDPALENPGDHLRAPTVRRTTRLRKPNQVQANSSMYSNDLNDASYKPSTNQRRRSKACQNSGSNTETVFLGMSDKALKSLTAHNTMQNQHYAVAKLETEIVRKEGARPESPAVKIKTIVQREQEEKLKQREERAARRAKRHGEDDLLTDENADDAAYQSANSTSDSRGLQLENALHKHRRGAGDEEDYETPLKNIEGRVNGQRRVKWDRGLFTEVFLDEVVLGSKVPPKENTATKGCLTATAKTLQLDTLGNLADLQNLPPDLTEENVVVKKFVYDDDFDTALQLQPPPPDRNTRSKSKKTDG